MKKNMQKKYLPFFLISIFLLAGFGIVWKWWGSTLIPVQVENSEDNFQTTTEEIIEEVITKTKPDPVVAKAIYLTAYSAGSEKKMEQMIDLINKTELNSVVIDIKDYSGKILYDSNVPMVTELDTEDVRIKDVPALIKKLHDNGIYVIARQTVMQDPILARKRPDLAIKRSGGGLWRDYKGLAWVDPTNKEVWQYNVDIAKEAIELGFDEINFDYVRYPSDGPIAAAVYSRPDLRRAENMREFFEFLSKELSEEPAYISLDFFGFVMEYHESDLSIGQRLVDAVDLVDYIAPMMYPSHYPSGHLGLGNPAAYPGAVIKNGMEKGVPFFEGERAQVRPWIQAFHLGATYGATNIRAQIDKIEEHPNAGWLLWNAANRYTSAGLKPAQPTE